MNAASPKTQITLPPMQPKSQASEVYDSFYELFLYEAIEQIVSKHQLKQTPIKDICLDIDDIGRQLGRKAIDLLARDMQLKFQTQLETMKFLCTEFWKFAFSKGVDNLRTNNAGTFIVVDDAFKFMARVSNRDHESKEYKEKIQFYEAFLIGMITGALMNLGYEQTP